MTALHEAGGGQVDEIDAGGQQKKTRDDREEIHVRPVAVRRKLVLQVRAEMNVAQRLQRIFCVIPRLFEVIARYVPVDVGLQFGFQRRRAFFRSQNQSGEVRF